MSIDFADEENIDEQNPYVLPQEEQPALFTRLIDSFEAWIAAFSGTVLSVFLVIVFLGATNLINAGGISDGLFVLIILIMAAVFQGPFLFRLWAATLLRERPIGPAVARRTRSRLMVVRVIATFWWLAHIILAMFIVVGGEVQLIKMANRPGVLFLAALLFGMSVCSNIFVALFVKAAWNQDTAVEKFWKWRLVIDASLTGIALLIASKL